MSTSKKKTEANRKNAKRSTGPTTPAGKQRSSRNALKHGAYANDLIIKSDYLQEDPAEYEKLLRSISDELQPDTLLQESLVRKIANCVWRARRIVAAETAHILSEHRYLADVSRTGEEEDDKLTAVYKSVPDDETARHLLYYEMRIDRQLSRTYRLFRELKRSALLEKALAASDALPGEPVSPEQDTTANPTPPDNISESTHPPVDLVEPTTQTNAGSPVFDETNPLTSCPPTS